MAGRAFEFQLTRPWEGATFPVPDRSNPCMCFNSRARGRARPCPQVQEWWDSEFQLTRPWEGATVNTLSPISRCPMFQLTRPWEGAT